jgi:hypothetical protein
VRSTVAVAQITVPVKFLVQWDDERVPRTQTLTLFDDALASGRLSEAPAGFAARAQGVLAHLGATPSELSSAIDSAAGLLADTTNVWRPSRWPIADRAPGQHDNWTAQFMADSLKCHRSLRRKA